MRLLILAALLPVLFQDPARPAGPDQSIQWWVRDPKTREIILSFVGYGTFDHVKGTGELSSVRVTFHTKPTRRGPSHTIHLFANRCSVEGVTEAAREQGTFKFSEGLRVMIDGDVRLWTPEGTFDVRKQVLACPKTTHVVNFLWPPRLDLASALTFMDPQEMEWLRLFGAPEPNLELVGDEFEFDAAEYVFTAAKNGRLRVKGRPGAALRREKKQKKPRPDRDEPPTELRSEGPLILRNLGAPDQDSWNTLHVTAERKVVVERRAKETVTRVFSDAAAIYVSIPPQKEEADPKPLSASFTGNVRIEEGRGFSAAADKLEWNHQEDLLRLIGAPRVDMTQGEQRLQAREVIVDQSKRTIDFKGEIVATFQPGRPRAPGEKPAGLMTVTPGDLRVRTDASGRPIGVHARNGVRISSPKDESDSEAIDAEGTEFEWDFATGEGLLRGAPFARLQQGLNYVAAPLITFRGETFDQSLMAIKGPKIMKFFTEEDPPLNEGGDLLGAVLGLRGWRPELREPTLNASATLLEVSLGLPGLQRIPGRRESVMDFVVTCDGDAVMDQEARFVKLVDRCSVRAQDSTLFADRLFVFLAKYKRGWDLDRVIGLGSVRASGRHGPGGGSLLIEGETLELKQDPKLGTNGQRVVTIVGHPKGRAEVGIEEFEFTRMSFNLAEKTIKMHDAKRR